MNRIEKQLSRIEMLLSKFWTMVESYSTINGVCLLHRFLSLQPVYTVPKAVHTFFISSYHFSSRFLLSYCLHEQSLNFLPPRFLLHRQFVTRLASHVVIPLGIHFAIRYDLAIYLAIHLAIFLAIIGAILPLDFEFGVASE